MNVQPGGLELRAQLLRARPRRPRRTRARGDQRRSRARHRPLRPRSPTSCRRRAVSSAVATRCFGALTRGLSAMPRANVAASPRSDPIGRKTCRPPSGLPSVGSMIIASLLIGLAIGAVAVLLAVRPALVERRRRVQEVIELERALAGAEAELAVERGSLDERLETAIKALSTQALDANSARFLELAETHLSGHVRPLKESLERMDQQLQSVERVRQESYGALKTEVTTPRRASRESHERASHAACARSLGRSTAPERRRVRGHGRALRLRDASDRRDGRRRLAPRPRRADSRREARRRGRQSAARRVSRRVRDLRRGRASAAVRATMLARSASTSPSSRPRATGASSNHRRTWS